MMISKRSMSITSPVHSHVGPLFAFKDKKADAGSLSCVKDGEKEGWKTVACLFNGVELMRQVRPED